MFLPLALLLKYWIEHVTIGFLYVNFIVSIRILYKRVPGLATDYACGVLVQWTNHLHASCMLVHFLKHNFKLQLVCKFDVMENNYFHCFYSLYACTFVNDSLRSRNIIIPCILVCLIFTSLTMFYFCQVLLYSPLPDIVLTPYSG